MVFFLFEIARRPTGQKWDIIYYASISPHADGNDLSDGNRWRLIFNFRPALYTYDHE